MISREARQRRKEQLKKDALRRKRGRRQKWERTKKRKTFFLSAMAMAFLIGVVLTGIVILIFLKFTPKKAEVSQVKEEKEIPIAEEAPQIQPEYREIEILLAEHTIVNENSSEARNHNMALAAEAIDGCVLQSEEWFEWSAVVGNTTAEKGYVDAPVIIEGNGQPALGGGVCQVSSTLFSALWDAYIVKEGHFEAEKHSKPSTYINPKVDHEATVAIDYEPKKDLRVQNTLECPIKIYAWTEGRSVTVQVVALVYIKIEGQN